MKQNNTTAAQKTAARSYKVSETTAALLDCITAASDLYSQITDALGMLYAECGEETQEAHALPFLNAINKLTDLLHKEIQGQIIDGLSITANSHSSNPVI